MSTYTQGNFGIAFKVDEEIGLQWFRSMDGLSEEQEDRLYNDRSIDRDECQSDWFIYDPRTDEWVTQWDMWEVQEHSLDRMNQVHPSFPQYGKPKFYTHELALFEIGDDVHIFKIQVDEADDL